MAESTPAPAEKEADRMKHKKDAGSTLGWISRVTAGTKRYIGILLLVQAVLGISSVCFAMLLRELVNTAQAGQKDAFVRASLLIVLLVLFQVALRAANRFFEEFSRATMENRLKERLFSILLTKDYASVTQVNSGEWINRLTSDTVVVADGLTQILPGAAGMAVKLLGALGAILYLEPGFAAALIPGGAVLLLFTYGFRKILKSLHKKIQEADGRLRIFLQERLTSLLIVRAFARERQTEEEAAKLMKEHRAARMKRNHFSNLCNAGFGIAIHGIYVAGAIYCGYGILTGAMSYGDLLAILQLVGQIQNPFANITGYLPKYYAMLASAERLREAEAFETDILTEEKEITGSDPHYNKEDFRSIGLRDAAFTYRPPVSSEKEIPMPVVLHGLSLEIRKGEYVAFTGPSGCGKSTVLKLLMCLYPLDGGARFLTTGNGGEPLTAKHRSLFAYVPQGNQLLSGSIREIVAFGDPEGMKREDDLWRALSVACADGFVKELDGKLDAVLGERGAGLSEGQMQRIAIARAVFTHRPVLLLDEATSALDEEIERKLLKNLRDMTDKTVVIVTHRPAALSVCDKNIDFGKIREC